ncbi:sodium bile acid symporter family-domain-containing protein [Leucosporidium creatinivorum]|uniref:Sodium bile acid symporter family-domain-containing protein n=1 Tax=Leucosporidium creatinivorum TaxID=106004 RepID=A0A1Y2F065_9BASI|nr:sodium bile acid symporter family-domain-containing protein [Leucosporidium creatinivorum]
MVPPKTTKGDLETQSEGSGTTAASKPSTTDVPTIKRLKLLDQLLALWIFLAMAIGIILGNFTDADIVLEKVKFVEVSLPLAIALIVMMWPILCRVSPTALFKLFSGRQVWYHLAFSLFVNWVFAPLLMVGLAWAFLPDRVELREGLILVGLARCIAMVLVWTDIAGGDGDYCAVLVAFNSVLQIVLYSPFAILYINTISPGSQDDIHIDYVTVARSVAAFLGIPLGLALLTRGFFILIKAQKFYQTKFLPAIAPLSLIALIFTTIIIFAGQGKQVVSSITDVLRVIAPLLVYFIIMFFLVLWICSRAGVSYGRSATQAFTGASNNFELAIAVAVSAYGGSSKQALAATVGPLVEVPVLLGLSYLLVWYRRRTNWDVEPSATGEVKAKRVGEAALV